MKCDDDIRHFDENIKPKHVRDELKGHKLQSPKLALSRSRRSRWLYSYYRYSQLNISLTKGKIKIRQKKVRCHAHAVPKVLTRSRASRTNRTRTLRLKYEPTAHFLMHDLHCSKKKRHTTFELRKLVMDAEENDTRARMRSKAS